MVISGILYLWLITTDDQLALLDAITTGLSFVATITMAMVMVGVVSSCYMEEGLVRTVITFISTWIVMLLVFVSCFMKKDEKLMLSRLIRKK